MTHLPTCTNRSRRPRTPLLLGLLAVAVAALGCGSSEPASRGTTSRTHPVAQHFVDMGSPPARPSLGAAPETVRKLDPDLLAAVEAASRAAQDDGVHLSITSGWRSRAHQQRLLDEAVDTYGSLEEALKFVSTPDTSAHVTGDAVDIGPTDADDWLSQHGADYGLCQVFANEIWHFELATTPGGECPDLLPDSSYRG